MQKTVSFKKKVIATTIASLAAGMSGAVFAQENNDTIDEVVVTGIKASLTRAMDIKRDAAGVVDAISAEDIGKMPDANLAESLQRISGVSIDRSSGEGSKVTVRGLAGDYNLVTVNGRQMPASSQANGGASVTRSFDFSNLASEGVAGVEVFKTGRADIATGGMGATVNIITPHPLKSPGLKATFGVKAVDDLSTETGDITPEYSGLVSDTFLDDTIGVSLSGSYQKRDSGDRQVNVGGWFNHLGSSGDWAGIADSNGVVPGQNAPTADQMYSHPLNLGYTVNETRRERSNANLTVQYKPIDTLTATADYIYVKKDVEVGRHSDGVWFNRAAGLDQIVWSGGNNKYPVTYSEINPVGSNGYAKDFDTTVGLTRSENKLESKGLNLAWDATDKLKVTYDGHYSTSTSGPQDRLGTDNGFDIATFTSYNPVVDFSGKIPILTLNPQPGVTAQPDPARAVLTGNYFKKGFQESVVHQHQLDAEYTFDDSILKSIKAGMGKTKIGNTSKWNVVDQQNQGNWNGVGPASDVDDGLFTIDTWTSHFDADELKNSKFQNTFLSYDFKQALAMGAKLYGTTTPSAANPCAMAYCTSPGWDTGSAVVDQRAVETSRSNYILGKFESDFNGRPVHVLAGLRYESTSVDAKSLLPTYNSAVIWRGGNEYSLDPKGTNQFFSDKGSYDELLPNLDYDIEVVDNVKVRLSYSRTMARPNYNQIQGGDVPATQVRTGGGTSSKGVPDLDPLLSSNYDISTEWYYGDASYVSVGYFKKDLHNFIGSDSKTIDTSYHTVYQGPAWQQAIASGIAPSDVDGIKKYIIDNNLRPHTNDSAQWIYATDADPTVPFVDTFPVNNTDFTVHGFEISIQHTFESGFGVQANATKVDSSVGYKNNQRGSQYGVLGLSDSANLVVFYEKDALSARLAYNWRDEFLNATAETAGNNPVYIEAYGQLDATASYKITDNLTVSLEGLNVLNETTRSHGRDYHEIINYTETGARYNLGARYTF